MKTLAGISFTCTKMFPQPFPCFINRSTRSVLRTYSISTFPAPKRLQNGAIRRNKRIPTNTKIHALEALAQSNPTPVSVEDYYSDNFVPPSAPKSVPAENYYESDEYYHTPSSTKTTEDFVASITNGEDPSSTTINSPIQQQPKLIRTKSWISNDRTKMGRSRFQNLEAFLQQKQMQQQLQQQHQQEYDEEEGEDHDSTVYRGTRFERETMQALDKYCFHVYSTGAAHDKGIDFRGVWFLDNNNDSFDLNNRLKVNIIGQCKCENKPIGTHYIREMEGVLSQQDRFRDHIAVFSSESGFTEYSLQHAKESSMPMILVTIQQGDVLEFFINKSASKLLPVEVILGKSKKKRGVVLATKIGDEIQVLSNKKNTTANKQ